MLRGIVIFVLIAGSAAFAFAAGQTGDPRYLVKAWIQKFDKSFEHATGWCGSHDICTLKVGEHEVRLHFFLTGDSYRLSVQADADDPAACCVFADKTEEAFISGGNPRRGSLLSATDRPSRQESCRVRHHIHRIRRFAVMRFWPFDLQRAGYSLHLESACLRVIDGRKRLLIRPCSHGPSAPLIRRSEGSPYFSNVCLCSS